MSQFTITLAEGGEVFEFTCSAEDYAHALEQARNAYPDAEVIG